MHGVPSAIRAAQFLMHVHLQKGSIRDRFGDRFGIEVGKRLAAWLICNETEY